MNRIVFSEVRCIFCYPACIFKIHFVLTFFCELPFFSRMKLLMNSTRKWTLCKSTSKVLVWKMPLSRVSLVLQTPWFQNSINLFMLYMLRSIPSCFFCFRSFHTSESSLPPLCHYYYYYSFFFFWISPPFCALCLWSCCSWFWLLYPDVGNGGNMLVFCISSFSTLVISYFSFILFNICIHINTIPW